MELKKGEHIKTALYSGMILNEPIINQQFFDSLDAQSTDSTKLISSDDPEIFGIARLKAMDTTSIILVYSYLFNLENVYDMANGNEVYLVIPSPVKINLDKTYTIPDKEIMISAWEWGAMLFRKCEASGTVTFSKFDPDLAVASLHIRNAENKILVEGKFMFLRK